MEASTSAAAPQAATPSRIMVIGEGEINRLKEDLNDLSKLIIGLVEKFDELQDHLVGVSQAENPSITAKCWMTQARQLFYDTGDYLYDSMHSGKEFKIFKARAENASERVGRLGIQPETPSMPMVRRLPAPPSADLADEINKDTLDKVEILLGTDEKLKVVSIVGPEGVGKTTLAKGLYRRYISRSANFQCWAFLRVSAKPDILRLLTSMFIQIQRKQPSNLLNAHQLIESMATYLQDKRYFVIIDDIWTEDVWGFISRAFPSDCCSRVITTTQIKVVALACCGRQSESVFKMEPLSAAQSEKLFLRSVFGSESGCPGDLKDVSDGIIRRCGGLPLACINIASMLPNTLKLEEWKGVLDFLPSTWSRNPGSEWMKEVVTLMYSTLRPHLKTCLLCFSMYPEGWIVRKDDLVMQWVLDGFLDGGTEEIAGGYFDELVRRGMIQPVITNKNGDVLSCTLHRIIHDFIVNKSMEENFVIMVDYSQSAIALPDKVRRLSVQFGSARSAHIPDNIVASKVRSLAFFGLFQCLPSMDDYSLLRVLILHIWADRDKESIDLAGIRKLLRLRYLKIACNIVVKLPDEIQGQQYMEILEVDSTIAAIPWDIGELARLRILTFAVSELSSEDICLLEELVALTALSVYVKTAPSECIVFRNRGFCDLKFFTFRCSEPLLVIEENAMPKIENLNLCFNAHQARQDGKKPITIRHLPSLKEISATIWGAGSKASSALENFVSSDSRNPTPIVQLMGSKEEKEHATLEEQDEIMNEGRDEVSGKDDSRLRLDLAGRDVNPLSGYRIFKTLGIGSFSKVKMAEHIITGHKVAIMILYRQRIKIMEMEENVKRELKILRLLMHPHIIRLYEVIDTPTDIYVVMEYAKSGDLFEYIVKKGSLDEEEARRFFQQIISGVEYCHRNMVVHRDLKVENILLDSKFNAKITGFCLSNVFRDGHFLNTMCGSPYYVSPEVISGKPYAGPEVDVWSCGVILYALVCGILPFDDENMPSLFEKIKGGIYTLPSHLSPLARDLITRMLVVDPMKRITVCEIREHSWFKARLPRYLAVPPQDTAEQVKKLDDETLNDVIKMGFDKNQLTESVQNRLQNEATVAYYVLLDNKLRTTSAYLGDDYQESMDSSFSQIPPETPSSASEAHYTCTKNIVADGQSSTGDVLSRDLEITQSVSLTDGVSNSLRQTRSRLVELTSTDGF